ncbi:glutaminase B [Providencia alcalifaciens]|uniref:Glutaminase n=1 Tax=Providencia alcalifaciens 205/92 TaxID=1256988 RepID=A0AAV3M468_9GAMM|nr:MULTISPECIES: glutaminase B [Providencia]ATG18243.1 glutaminase [Providencia alcalifaciens]EKT64893.1 glutaminase [Providencia alcalifaciens Dmel2]EUD06706.1 glutaminase A [Providencia alcalifaciens R90-1475]EUD10545.1 glutaminase A [Providencia alcalifaciens 205/92]MBF0691223.1 glutaminase B [Providencia alcalifaciens]
MSTQFSDQLLHDILEQVRPLIGQGTVADYIPALGGIPSHHLGIAVHTAEGDVFTAGDAKTRFSIQSISKVLSLTLAMTRYEEQEIWSRVGKEPSGLPFNSLIQIEMEKGIPRNPFINAGAIVIADMLQSRLSAPKQRMLEFVRKLACEPDISYDTNVARSEMEHASRNAAIAYLMKSFGNFDNDVLTVLETYFHYCSLSMNCVELARCFTYLMNQGESSCSIDPIITPLQSRQINALMMTCGMYDGSGEFAFRIGMPGKSGVGGGIVCVVPNQFTVAVWSPELDSAGNSLVGCAALELLSKRIGRSVF